MAETPKTTDKAPDRSLSEREVREREDDLERAMKLFASISESLGSAIPSIEKALSDADKLRQMCDRSPVLRAAMVSRRLGVQAVSLDLKRLRASASLVSGSVVKSARSRKDELERAVKDPELLR